MSISINDDRQFGLFIAYILPGFLVINGLACLSPTMAGWLAMEGQPTLGGFLYVILSSIGAGLVTSTVRWLTIDRIHHWTGLSGPTWQLDKLAENLDAFEMLVAYHYRYYQFYGNTLVAIPVAWACFYLAEGASNKSLSLLVAAAILEMLFILGSRDTLSKYYSRSNELLQRSSSLLLQMN